MLLKLNQDVSIPYETDKSILVKVTKGKVDITSFLAKKIYNFKSNTFYIKGRTTFTCRTTEGSDVKDVEVPLDKFVETFGSIVAEAITVPNEDDLPF